MSSRLRSPAHVGHATAAPVCVRSREARTAALAPASMSETVQPDRLRSFEFWRRAGTIYANYKVAQAQASWMHFRGHTKEYIEENHWIAHHDKAGRDMYGLCVDLRGFFIKAGQFIGARSDFVPEGTCVWLRKLQDEVPPLSPQQVTGLLQGQLGLPDLHDVFEWIDLEKPLGSASIAQVHKAQLRQYRRRPGTIERAIKAPLRAVGSWLGLQKALEAAEARKHVVVAGESEWSIANIHGVGLGDLRGANKRNPSVALDALVEGQEVWLPPSCTAVAETGEARRQQIIEAVGRSNAHPHGPENNIVAVKVQYPDALPLFNMDLKNLRGLAGFLSKTELAFDLVSAVDELSSQVQFEFDFQREARVMDTVAEELKGIRSRVIVPTSVPGLVTDRLLVMQYLDGVPLTQLGSKMSGYSEAQKRVGLKRVLTRSSEAYGRMILGSGLFQADGHPGNILVMEGGKVGLIDFGQSKQLSGVEQRAIAQMMIALCKNDEAAIVKAVADMGIRTGAPDNATTCEFARGMFDTSGSVDPFADDSPIKRAPIIEFPKQFFLVLRVVQLFRGLASRMDIQMELADQWRPFAEAAMLRHAAEDCAAELPAAKAKYYGI